MTPCCWWRSVDRFAPQSERPPQTDDFFLLRPVHLARVLCESLPIKWPEYLHCAKASVCRVLEWRDDGEPQAAIVDVEYGIEYDEEDNEITENCSGASFIAVRRDTGLPRYIRYHDGWFAQALTFVVCNRRRPMLPPELVCLIVHEFVFLRD